MSPPQLFKPEYLLREIVDRKVMEKLLDRIVRFYDDWFMEIVYRAHHNSFKVSYADIFYDDFVNYVVRACRLKKRIFWRYLPEESTLRYMHERRRRFFRYLKKPREKRKHRFFGDIKWSFEFWLTQLSFWYATVKAFANTWSTVVIDKEDIPQVVDWNDAITLYIIADFKYVAQESDYKAIKKKWIPKYEEYIELEKEKLRGALRNNSRILVPCNPHNYFLSNFFRNSLSSLLQRVAHIYVVHP